MPLVSYRGRLAPSPTGYLHLGHARTFWIAQVRSQAAGGTLVLRNEDLDAKRFRLDFVDAMLEDMRWLGLRWTEGPDVGGPYGPYDQSDRRHIYRGALERLHRAGFIFPCTKSRRDVLDALSAPHESNPSAVEKSRGRKVEQPGSESDEPIYPARFRPTSDAPLPPLGNPIAANWRFRVPDGETIRYEDARLGSQAAIAGRDFGDFLIWRKDDAPSYQLACAVDDGEMKVTEVVRGADLVMSTFRQILILRALGLTPPQYYHCPLMTDGKGERLAKRHDALSLRALREKGITANEIIAGFGDEIRLAESTV